MKAAKTTRIATLTWRLRNYGTALQAYALQRWINDNGAACRVIKLVDFQRVRVNPVTPGLLMTKALDRIANRLKAMRNRPFLDRIEEENLLGQRRFADFYADMPCEETAPTVENRRYYDDNYDFVIVGSDQVWNPKYFSETYFLDFVPEDKRASYAPSLGVSSLTKNEREFLLEHVAPFRYLSVRETTSAGLLGREDLAVVCDPVMLLSAKRWSDALQLKPAAGDYLFVYVLSANRWYKRFIKEEAARFGTQNVVLVTPTDKLYFYAGEFAVKVDMGPKEWLEYLAGAKAVVTDSFHGACFAVLFEKEFVVLQRFKDTEFSNENARVTDMLRELDLLGHFVKPSDAFDEARFPLRPGYELRLAEMRDRSAGYLSNIINGQ